ncbi:MAG: DUF4129 domain-containing protein [Dehalococcoidia bacterium]
MIAAVAIGSSLLADGFLFAVVAELLAAGYDKPDQHAFGAWAFAIVALAGYVVPRAIEGFDIEPRKGHALAVGIGLFLIYLLVRIEGSGDIAVWDFSWIGDFLGNAEQTTQRGGHSLTGAILLLATWARTTLRSGDEVEMEAIPRSFAIPFAVVTSVIVIGAATDRSGEVGRAGAAFYTVAILSLVSSQLAMSGATFGEVRAGSTAGILLAGTAAVAVVGLLVIGLVTTILSPIVGPVLSTVTEWTLTIILTPFAWILEKIFSALFGGKNPFPELTDAAVQRSNDAANPDQKDQSAAGAAGLFVMRAFALLAFFAIVGLAVGLFVRLRKSRVGETGDTRQGAVAGSFREDFGSMFRSMFRRGASKPEGYASTEATRLYLEVLGRAEKAGHARPGGDTAREFAPELKATFTSSVTDDITFAFESARYAGREPDARTLAELRRRWQAEAREPD